MTVGEMFDKVNDLVDSGVVSYDSEVVLDSVFSNPLSNISANEDGDLWLESKDNG